MTPSKQTPFYDTTHVHLIESIRENDWFTFRGFLRRKDINIDFQDSNGMTPLMWSIIKNNHKIFDDLVSHGARLDIKDKKGRTLIMIAAQWANPYILKRAISLQPKSINDKDMKGQTALYYADFDLLIPSESIDILLNAGANPWLVDNKGETALQETLRSKNWLKMHHLFFKQLRSTKPEQALEFIQSFRTVINTDLMAEKIFSTIRETEDNLDKLQFISEILTPSSSLGQYLSTELKPTAGMDVKKQLIAVADSLAMIPHETVKNPLERIRSRM